MQKLAVVPTFSSELHRRKVYRTAVYYGVAAWLAVQVADTTFPYLGLPDGAVTGVIVSAIVGLPFALGISWAFDLARTGFRFARSKDRRSASASTTKWQRVRVGTALTVGTAAALLMLRPFVQVSPAARLDVTASSTPPVASMPVPQGFSTAPCDQLGLAPPSPPQSAGQQAPASPACPPSRCASGCPRFEIGHLLPNLQQM